MSGADAPSVREAIEADARELAALAERVFRATFGADNTPEDMDGSATL